MHQVILTLDILVVDNILITFLLDRIDYSNDTVSEIAMSSPSRQSYSGSTGNSSGGYYAGGRTNPLIIITDSLVRRIDYSNDTENPVIKGNLIEGNMSSLVWIECS